ncbi:type IX secretion system sortase PorU [Williamwhitmania taraxaci]|nr:type IX secretion system sortase PorU [Williamwhitmania taraxaci]
MAINSFPLFDGMFYLNNDPIPHLFYKIPTPFEYRPDAISVFFDQTKVTIDDHISNTFISASTLKDDFSGNAYISTENGRQYLCITMIPFRKGPTGIEKLLSADLTLVTSGSVISRKKSNGNNRSANSVLADGLWKKIKISKTGIYRLTYDNLISMGFLNPSKVTLWGSQSTMLAKTPSSDYPVDLQQIPTSFLLGSDNQFNSGDMAVFFLQDAVDWKYNSTNRFNHQIHDYSDFAYYFITDSKPSTATIVTATKITNANTFSTSYDDYTYIEREDTNLIKSGRGWFGESFDILDSRNYSFPIPDLITTAPIWARMRTAARSSSSSSFTLSYAGNPVLTTTHSGVSYDETSAAANISEKSATFSASNSPLNINITYSRPSPSAAGWLDFLELNFRRNLNLSTPYVLFRDQTVVGDGKITEFSISSGIAESQLWEISSLWDVKRVETSLSNGILKGVVNTSIMKEYIAFNSSRLESPTVVGSVENQNLTGATPANLVIVSAPNYITQAQRISNLHKSADGLTTLVVTSQEVFNEFSGGKPDAAAIRNFLKFLTEKATSPETTPRYLLLFGDGSYKNRNLSPESPFMITYQSDNSLEVLNSYVSDDFFGLLDIGEVPGTGLMDIGVGRLPASNAEEAKVMVDKIESYMNPTSSMDWVNKLTFIGDDEDGNIHMRDANTIATYVETTYPNYIVDKIYFDSYAQISSPSGARYPDVTDAINKKVNKGALIVNYTGHGNEQYLAHERVVSIADIMSWTNKNKLALFITATCEFSRYDDYNRTSAGEYILLNPNGGGVALLSTTRLVYSNPNFTLNDNFFHKVFEKGMDGEYPRLGDLVRDAKNNTGPDFNKLNFSLLGDPALKLNNSTIQINAEKLNGKSLTTAFVDTLKALSKVTIEGSVNTTRASGEGNVNILFYDKEKEVTTLNNDNGTPFIYKTRSSILYQGNATIKNGTFKSEFIVPKDIAYNIGKGKLYLQATTGQSVGLANFSDFLVGGINTNAPTDISPPSVELFLNDENFVDGGITPEQPKLIAIIEDSSGINTTGNGIGHDIIAEITGTTSTKIVLNDYYKANQDSYTAGKIEYPLEKLQPGEYSLSLKVWDTYNNSGSKKLSFRVVKEENFTIEHLLNYPNPFTENTAFYFEHNRPNNNLDVLIQVFTLSGKLVKTIEYSSLPPTSLRIGPIFWDGKDDFGDNIGRGTYVYRVRVRTNTGESVERFEKLVILK